MTKTEATQKVLQRYVSSGGTEARGMELLDEQLRSFTPSNLPCALIYHGLATRNSAQKIAAALTA